MLTSEHKRLVVRLAMQAVVMSLGLSTWSSLAQGTGQVDGPQRSESKVFSFNLPEQPLSQALQAFARASGEQVIFSEPLVSGKQAPALRGSLTADEALQQLLRGSRLTVERSPSGAVMIRSVAQGTSIQAPLIDDQSDPKAVMRMPEVMVTGSKALNMDIRRTPDDVQPYVVLDRETIERSGSQNLDDLLKQRLPMNTVARSASQTAGTAGAISSVNLRGLGANQTLILVDGHRVSSGFSFGTTPTQPDISAIPLAAIERIEVLPTTASGIYGGGATGGVVNIIRRRDYEGAEAKVSYDTTLRSRSAIGRIDAAAGFNLEGTKTNVLLGASYSESNPLLVGDRDFVDLGRRRIFENNPSFYLNAANPPLGSTTNLRSINGSPLFGPGTAAFASVPDGYVGGGGVAPLLANAGRYNFDLADSAQGEGRNRSLTASPIVQSASATVRRRFGADVEAFLDAALSDSRSTYKASALFTNSSFTIPANAPTNPFGQAIQVTVPTASVDQDIQTKYSDRRVVAGVIFRLPAKWSGEADYTWERFRTFWQSTSSLNGLQTAAIASGSLNLLRDTRASPVDFSPFLNPPGQLLAPQFSTLKDATVRVSGPVWTLPAGKPTLTALVEHREEALSDALQFSSPGVNFYYPSRSQSVDSAYAELKLPLVSSALGIPGVRALEAQLAVRRDEYSVEGSTAFATSASAPVTRVSNKTSSTNPTIGIRYEVNRDAALRASYGTGFLPPSVTQLIANAPVTATIAGLVDPRRGNQTLGSFLLTSGGRADLGPEKSESYSIGAIATPGLLPGLRLSVDYTRIKKTNNISSLSQQQVIDNEAILQGRVTRGVNLPTDLAGWAGPITAIDTTSANIAKADVEAIDFSFDYARRTARLGTLSVFAAGTWQPHFKTQLVPTTPVVENVQMGSANPLKFKANAGFNWTGQRWTAGWVARYFGRYFVANPSLASSAILIRNQGSARIPSQTYHDTFAGYGIDFTNLLSLGGSQRLEMQAGVKNLFNRKPPFDAAFILGNVPAYYSAFGDPRLRSLYVSARVTF